MTPPDGYRQAGQGWHRKCHDGSPTVVRWFDSTAAHTPPGVIPALQAHITGGEDGRQPTRSADTKTAPRLTTGQRTKKGGVGT